MKTQLDIKRPSKMDYVSRIRCDGSAVSLIETQIKSAEVTGVY